MPFFSRNSANSHNNSFDDSSAASLFETASNASTDDNDLHHHHQEQQMRDTSMLTFSFAAAGWLQVYLFGCCHALIENVPGVRIEGLHDSHQEYLRNQNNHNISKDNNNNSSTTATDTDGGGGGGGGLLPKTSFDSTQDFANMSTTKTPPLDTEGEDGDNNDARKLDGSRIKFIGSSAGALASAAILLGTEMPKMLEYAVECVNYCRSHWTHAFELRSYVEKGIAKFAIDVFKRERNYYPKQNNISSCKRNKKKKIILEKLGEEESDDIEDEEEEEGEDESTAKTPPVASPTTLAAGADQFVFLSEEDKEHGLEKMKTRAAQLGTEGGWIGKEYFFPKHIRDQLSKRLEVYATSLPWIQEICFDDFESTIDLEEALVASCLLTPLAGLPFRLRKKDVFVMDGGLRSFQPRKGQPGVITISAMYFSAADIVPSRFVPAWYGLYPPDERKYREIFALGHNDMMNWLWKHKFVNRPKTEQEMQAKLMKYDDQVLPDRHEKWWGYVLDFFTIIFYLGIFRPFTMIAIYAELWFVAYVSLIATIFHEFFPRTFDFLIGTKSLRARKAGGRMDTWQDFWASLRNLFSYRTWLHLAVGYRSVNSKRLGRYSRMYRLFRPFVAGTTATHDTKKKK